MSTAVHHVNCASMAPLPSFGGRVVPARMVAHCLIVETADRLVLVDSGFGTADLESQRMGRAFITAMRPALDPAETAASHVRALGHDPDDVTDIVLTHLDLDHAGGIGDFPGARVHVFADELAAALAPATINEKQRYIAAQWAHGPQWVEHRVDGDDWFGFTSVRALGDDLVMIPLRGHTRGHCGVAVRRPAGGWFLHAGDSYFNQGEKRTPPSCPPGLALFQTMVQVDAKARKGNQERLRSLHADAGPGSGATETVTIFSAHDAAEFDDLAGTTD